MIVPALLGAVILTDATRAFSYVRTESGSSLVLTGVIAYTDPRQGFAIIGSSVQNTYLARPGGLLPDGSRIREIHPRHVVLEREGSLEIVQMYERGAPAGAAYAQIPPPPQAPRWEEAELNVMTAGETIPSEARLPDVSPSHPQPIDTRPNETLASQVRSSDAAPSDTFPKQAQPEVPLPTAQDPVDEISDYRRPRVESHSK